MRERLRWFNRFMNLGGTKLVLSVRNGLGVMAVVLAGLWAGAVQGQAQDRQGALVGKRAPAFSVGGIWNENYSLETFKGHILVMQFGSSW